MIKSMAVVFFIGFSLIIYWGWLIVMPNVTYTDKDFFKYYLLTYKEIRNAPRLSENYFFEYGPSDESSPQSSVIYFCDLKNIDENLQKMVLYINNTHIPLIAGYSWDNPPRGEYFYLGKVGVKGNKCLMLMLSKEVN
ncbi:hypothetical protein [Edaphovirga cremea]|uniref:hypothetical protein n=1 Tax=Edaphovirga cremea TaxID=2267246 RepID=UPI001FE93445|nr:hypothetical protein [Edaphovirga cremea]